MQQKTIANITDLVSHLLFKSNGIIIANLGAFITDYNKSGIDSQNHFINPANKKVKFNQDIKEDDGVLVQEVSAQEKITKEEAQKLVAEFALFINNTLDKKNSFEFKNIGTLYKNKNSNLLFVPYFGQNFLTKSYGLEPVKLKAKYFPKTEPKARELSTTSTKTIEQPIVFKKETTNDKVEPKLNQENNSNSSSQRNNTIEKKEEKQPTKKIAVDKNNNEILIETPKEENQFLENNKVEAEPQYFRKFILIFGLLFLLLIAFFILKTELKKSGQKLPWEKSENNSEKIDNQPSTNIDALDKDSSSNISKNEFKSLEKEKFLIVAGSFTQKNKAQIKLRNFQKNYPQAYLLTDNNNTQIQRIIVKEFNDSNTALKFQKDFFRVVKDCWILPIKEQK